MQLSYFHVAADVPDCGPDIEATTKANAAVVIDVLRATTTIAWALHNGAEAVQAMIHDWMARRLLGEDALAIESHWRFLYERAANFGVRGTELRAISALDVALWDILGQACNRPIYRLLGGPVRDKILVYNSCGNPKYGPSKEGRLGWPGMEVAADGSLDPDGDLNYEVCPVSLSDRDIAGYLHGFSNRTLWPLLHSLTQHARYDRKEFQAYARVNARFADALDPLLRVARCPSPCATDHDRANHYYLKLVGPLSIYGYGLATREATVAEIAALVERHAADPDGFARSLVPDGGPPESG